MRQAPSVQMSRVSAESASAATVTAMPQTNNVRGPTREIAASVSSAPAR